MQFKSCQLKKGRTKLCEKTSQIDMCTLGSTPSRVLPNACELDAEPSASTSEFSIFDALQLLLHADVCARSSSSSLMVHNNSRAREREVEDVAWRFVNRWPVGRWSWAWRLSRDAPRSFLIEQSDMNTHGPFRGCRGWAGEDRCGKAQRKTSSWRELFLPKQQPEMRSGTEPMAHLAAILASCDEEACQMQQRPTTRDGWRTAFRRDQQVHGRTPRKISLTYGLSRLTKKTHPSQRGYGSAAPGERRPRERKKQAPKKGGMGDP